MEADTNDFVATTSLGWYCDESKGQYSLKVYRDEQCTILSDQDEFGDAIIAYTDNACLPVEDYDTFWTNVECKYFDGETGTTKSPDAQDPNSGNLIYTINAIFICLFVTIAL